MENRLLCPQKGVGSDPACNRHQVGFKAVITTPGPIGVVGQNGTVVAALTDWAQEEGFGVSVSISLGNQADVCEFDLLRLLLEDENTRSIALYLEVSTMARASLRWSTTSP